MLRASAKRAVFEILDDTYFGASNFGITYGDGSPWVQIEFVSNPAFKFVVTSGNSLTMQPYQVREAPGVKLLSADIHGTQSFELAIARIPDWVKRIKEEVIDSNPINRELQAIRKELNQRVDGLAENQDEFFTQAEADQLAAKLREFSSKLSQLSKENSELNETVSQLMSKLDELAVATGEVNKGTWFRMAGSKILNVAKSVIGSKEAREFALEAAKKVLLEGPK